MRNSVWVGFDPREAHAYAVTTHSIQSHMTLPIPVRPLIMRDLERDGLYTRETIKQDGLLYDVVSDHAMATEFAISRFLVPELVRRETKPTGRYVSGTSPDEDRLALFMDADMLVRKNLWHLFMRCSPRHAVTVVKHDFRPSETTKMDGQVQSQYDRKNWSSVMVFNVDHPSNRWLTVENVNATPGRDLHRFCWLKDDEIGELSPEWNYLVGHHTAQNVPDPAIVHFTDGIPTMRGYEQTEYAEEWNASLRSWARGQRR